MNTIEALKDAQTIVVKIGTALVARADGKGVRQDWLDALAADIQSLVQAGKKIAIISSGGVALGRTALGIALDAPPQSIPLEKKQASSAVGQFHVFNGFHQAFAQHDLKAAQILLTMGETENRRMHLNARATLAELMSAGIIPVINENDTVSTGEIRFGDNDRLAARVAQMIGADALILLSTIDGLYTVNPQTDSNAEHIPVIETLDQKHSEMAGDALPGMSTGGMKSKIEAAQAATAAGVSMIIADGQENHALKNVIEDKNTRTTLFLAHKTSKTARKKWIGSHVSPKGTLLIDEGALNALKSGKSLLPIGVKDVKGNFDRGDAVEIKTLDGQKVGMGLSAYSAEDAAKIMNKQSADISAILGYTGRSELIHRNDLVLNL